MVTQRASILFLLLLHCLTKGWKAQEIGRFVVSVAAQVTSVLNSL